jgi:phospholipid/cholesterol/gamma-HCH transport system substrate-binding protein
MLVNIHHDTPAEHRRLLVAGVAFLTTLALLIWLSIAIYDKAFQSVTTVTVYANRAGLQLPKFGDVRMHGMIVGQIRNVSQDGDHAVITLGIDPKFAQVIPADVSVEILPTTLFGQKYVEFVGPAYTSGPHLANDQVIQADRVTTTVELETVLARLYPLLTAVRPADLAITLNSLAKGLLGRGDELGQTFARMNTYLGAMNVHLPTLRSDLAKLANVAQAYSMSAPNLVSILRNATTTARTISSQAPQLATAIGDFTALGNDGASLLEQNGSAIITEARLAAPVAQLLDVYSPEYPCLLKGLDRYTGRLNAIFQHSRVNQTMILSGVQQSAYTPSERPVYAGVGHGPWCLGLPVPSQTVPQPRVHVPDGTNPARRK